MERIYEFLLDNIYVFCVIMAAFFVIMVMIFYYIQNRKFNKNNQDDDYISDDTIDKEKLESITDEEIEKRVMEEYKKEQEEVNKILENKNEDVCEVEEKDEGTNIEEILSALEKAKRVEPSEALKTFEEEQEEQAIISYKQLKESVLNNKIKIEDDEKYYKNQSLEEEKFKILNEEINAEPIIDSDKAIYGGRSSNFKNEFISPVFGRMDASNVLYRQGLEYTDKKPKKEYIKDNPTANEFIDNYEEKPKRTDINTLTDRLSRLNYDNHDEDTNNYPDRTTLYRSKTTVDHDTEIHENELNNLQMKHDEKMDSEEFLSKLKEFRNNL